MCKDGKQSCWHQRYYGNEYVCTVPVFMRLFSIFRKVYHSLSMIVTWSTTMCVCPPCLSIRLGNGNWGAWTTCTPLKARIVCRLLRFSLYLTDMIHQKRLRTGEAQGRKNGNSCFIRHVKKKMNLLQQFHIIQSITLKSHLFSLKDHEPLCYWALVYKRTYDQD